MRDPIVNIAVKAARVAGNIIVKAQERLESLVINQKKPGDFVTDIDQLVEREIIHIIRKAHPNHGILGEESGEIAGNEFTWIIDPIDGTRNFIHGFPQFAVSIAIRKKNKIEHGVIYDPIRQELFSATRGKGARLNDHRIRVSTRNKLEDTLLGTSAFPTQYENLLQVLNPICDLRCAGAATLDLAYVACGRFDGYWESGLKLWDLAAGILLVKEAGGLVCDLDGSDNYLTSGNVLAGNPKILKLLLKTIKSTQ
ncbi:MAG TPA: inositol monophosphatase family protein [Gammaproteobacteria bacterium]|jgi:myo-inositol-1(or 4)-monophosphatase|nr:inositol monophosphatase family protein [Gammaproteobacteria bacterium]